ncbi:MULTISPECIES: acyl-CoA thioesterase [Novosphingobium]|jgi:acyl-CoA thioesterase YciA|uniref:Acyl-CoA thioesterase YciA n=1 Tax=Novosphingobium panipatense TaxID=428991 RepID=A0ABY1Q5I5_9SPHN|nr:MULTISPECIES: acyl-CoA thioesterase [Novosphingobium]SMP57747.1 acyl-CoA thioesterase YciA [Novosphingobium panipatense]
MDDFRDPVIRVTAMPADTNAYGDIFGGWLLSLMDSGAGLVAARYSRGRAVTIALDGMKFHKPVKVGDEVSVYGAIRKVGRTSMTIGIEAYRRHRAEEERVKVTEAIFTFVAIDDAGLPRVIEQED